MTLSFEVRETDLLGRIGRLTVAGRSLETPYLFPVIHPVSQAVPLGDLTEMGFGGIMTNSYILYKRRREEAVSVGLHKLLGYDGVVMTDSGGYQVLEYGDLDVSYGQIAEFQSKMGSNLAVTLDKPTGYSSSRRYAEGTMQVSLRDALATMREFGESDTVWVGPVQGGLFGDLLRKSARALVGAGFEMLALGSPVQVMENYRYAELVKMIVATRTAVPYSLPLHLFGAGHPHTMALAVALGCDTFDSASYILFAREGRYMTERGATKLKEMKYLPCSCRVCAKTSVGELLELEPGELTKELAVHNLYVLRKELEGVKEAVVEGRLWDLVEEKSGTHPKLQEAFAEFARATKHMQAGTPPMKERGLFVRGEADRARPEMTLTETKLRGAMMRSSRIAVLLSSGDALPITRLRFKQGARPKGDFDLYRVHPEFGVYPAELDFVYPFTQTVTANLGPGKGVEDSKRSLRSLGYTKVIVGTVDARGRISIPGPNQANRSKLKRRKSNPR